MSCADSDEQRKQNTERYRSGHNEAVLKTVCPQGHVGSNPTLSVHYMRISCDNIIIKCYSSNYGEIPKLAEGAPLERE